MKKIYFIDDLSRLLYSEELSDLIKDEFKKLENISECIFSLMSFDTSLWDCKEDIDNYAIGTRPTLHLKDESIIKINSKRIINKNGFSSDCQIRLELPDIPKNEAVIFEDVIVTGCTINKVLSLLKQKYTSIYVNVLFGYQKTISTLAVLYPNVNFVVQTLLYEEPIRDSTIIFISDLLLSNLNNHPYLHYLFKALPSSGYTEKKILESLKVIEVNLCSNGMRYTELFCNNPGGDFCLHEAL